MMLMISGSALFNMATTQDGGAEEWRDLQWSVGLLRWFHEPVPCLTVLDIFGHWNVVMSLFLW